jgi:hypothetical protein
MHPLHERLTALGYRTSDWTTGNELLMFKILIVGWKVTIVASERRFALMTDEQVKEYIDACVNALGKGAKS